MRNTSYNLSGNNRNNTIQIISIGITERFSKPEEILNNRDLVDLETGIVHRKGIISIPTNERVFDDKYHHSNIFKLYPRSWNKSSKYKTFYTYTKKVTEQKCNNKSTK